MAASFAKDWGRTFILVGCFSGLSMAGAATGSAQVNLLGPTLLGQFGNVNEQTIRWRNFASGNGAKAVRPTILLAGDAGTLENIWTRDCLNSGRIPQVDFTKDRVVFFFLGQRATGGFKATIRSIVSNGGTTATAYINEMAPPIGSVNTQAVTSPWVAAIVDRSYLDFRLQVNTIQSGTSDQFGQMPGTIQFQNTPLSTVTVAWSPFGTGWIPQCQAPSCWEFNDPRLLNTWCQQNGVNFGDQVFQNNFTARRFVVATSGPLFAGFVTSVQSVYYENNQTWIRLQQGGRATSEYANRSYVTGAFIDARAGRAQVELALDLRGSMIQQGIDSPFIRPGTYVVRNAGDMNRLMGRAGRNAPRWISEIDYKRGPIGVISVVGANGYSFQMNELVIRGNTARAKVTRRQSPGQNNPFFVVRLAEGVRNFELIQ